VKETPLFHTRFDVNNYQSPTVGSVQGLVTVEDTNLTGLGDNLSFQYGQSEGIIPIINARYALPLNKYDTTFSATYRKFDFKVIDSDFESLDIRNNAFIYGFSLRQPLYHTLQDEFAISLTAEYEQNTSSLLGQPFEFVAGATDGLFRIAPLRFAQEYTHQTTEQIIAAFSRFSVGIGWLRATRDSNVQNSATSQFFSWLGEAQWVRQLPILRTQMVARTTMQFSNEHLFPLEQIAVGGRYSVRGYREYTFVRDNAFLASFEFRVPVFTTANGMDRVHLAPFVDVGRSWNTNVSNTLITTPVAGSTEDIKTIASVGIGMLITFTETSRFEIYWGQQLNHLKEGTGNLQDIGIHLGLVIQLF
jgi:hemolysin activation/secretion protein